MFVDCGFVVGDLPCSCPPALTSIVTTERKGIRETYEENRKKIGDFTYSRVSTDDAFKVALLVPIVAERLLRPDGEIDAGVLEEVRHELIPGDRIEESIERMLEKIAICQPFLAKMREVRASGSVTEKAIVNITLRRDAAHPISDTDVRCALLAHCLAPAVGTNLVDLAWEEKTLCIEHTLDDLQSLLNHGCIERTVLGQKYRFFGKKSKSFLDEIRDGPTSMNSPGCDSCSVIYPPLVDQWKNAVLSMECLPSSLMVNRPEWRTLFYQGLSKALCDAALALHRDDVAQQYQDAYVLLTAHLYITNSADVIIKRQELECLSRFRVCCGEAQNPMLCVQEGDDIVECDSADLFVKCAKKVLLDMCGSVNQSDWSRISSDGSTTIEDCLITALRALYSSCPAADPWGMPVIIFPMALGAMTEGVLRVGLVPGTFHHVALCAQWLRGHYPYSFIPSGSKALLLREPSLVSASEHYADLVKKTDELLNANDQKIQLAVLTRFYQVLVSLVVARQGIKLITLDMCKATLMVLVKSSMHPLQKTLREMVQKAEEITRILLTEAEVQRLDEVVLNSLYELQKDAVEQTLVKFAQRNNNGLYFWLGPIGGECQVEYCRSSFAFSVLKKTSISWSFAGDMQQSPELREASAIQQILLDKGLEGCSLDCASTGTAPLGPDIPKGEHLISALQPVPVGITCSITEARRKFLSDMDGPEEVLVDAVAKQLQARKEAWPLGCRMVEEAGIPLSLIRMYRFPYLIADALVLPDGEYNWGLIDDVIRELTSQTRVRDDADGEIISMLYRFQSDLRLKTALESIPVPTRDDSCTLIRRSLHMEESSQVSLRDVRHVCLAVCLTCVRQCFAPDCYLFSKVSSIKDCHPEVMLSHFKDLMMTGGIRGYDQSVATGGLSESRQHVTDDQEVLFRSFPSSSSVTVKNVRRYIAKPCVQKQLQSDGIAPELFLEKALTLIREKGVISMQELLAMAGVSKELYRQFVSATECPLFEMWELALGGVLFPPATVNIDPIEKLRKEWTEKLLVCCYSEAKRLRLTLLASRLYGMLRTVEGNQEGMDPLFCCLNSIRHGLRFDTEGLYWVPYTMRANNPSLILPDDRNAFEGLFLDLCESVYKDGSELTLAREQMQRPTYQECFEEAVHYQVTPAGVTFGECRTLHSSMFQKALAHWIPSGPVNVHIQQVALWLEEGDKTARVFVEIVSHSASQSMWRGITAVMGNSGHAFRVLPNHPRCTDRGLDLAKQLQVSMWERLWKPESHLASIVSQKIQAMVELRFPKEKDLLAAVSIEINKEPSSGVRRRNREVLLDVMTRVREVVKRRFNDRELRCIELAAFRGISTDYPQESVFTFIPFADTNWMKRKGSEVEKIVYGFYFSPLSGSWRIATASRLEIEDTFEQIPAKLLQIETPV